MVPTCSEFEVYPVARDLLRAAHTRRARIRLLGVGLSNLGLCDDQLKLFDLADRRSAPIDAIRERFGYDAVRVARRETCASCAISWSAS